MTITALYKITSRKHGSAFIISADNPLGRIGIQTNGKIGFRFIILLADNFPIANAVI
jgi:hypothetical protein